MKIIASTLLLLMTFLLTNRHAFTQTNDWENSKVYRSVASAIEAQQKGEKVYNLSVWQLKSNTIDTTIVQLTDLKSLSIGNPEEMITLPSFLTNLTSLEAIYLYIPKLLALPDDFNKLQNLKILVIRNVDSTIHYPDNAFDLPLLEELTILNLSTKNGLPASFANLCKLKKLEIDACTLVRFPENFKPKFLKDVTIRNCKNVDMLSVCRALANSDSLTHLNIENSNVSEIPAEIANLKPLLYFNSHQNPIKQLPTEIAQLENLNSIHISGSNIEVLPKTFESMKNLMSLSIGSKVLLDMEGIIETVSQMNVLALGISSPVNNKLPDNVGKLSKLHELSLTGNRFETLPASLCTLTNLKYLFLPKCKILPNDIHKLKNLEYFDFYLEEPEMEELPENFWELERHHYDFRGNKLKKIPEFKRNYEIEMLVLQVNNLTKLPSSISKLENLIELHLDMNKLKVLPESMKEMDNLKVLGLCCIPTLNLKQAFGVIKEMKGLERLDISKSYLNKLPEIAFECKQLTSIHVIDDVDIDSRLFTARSMEELKNIQFNEPVPVTKNALAIDSVSFIPMFLHSAKKITAMKKAGNNVYFATERNGLIQYKLSEKKLVYYNILTSNIPANDLYGITAVGDTLYAIANINYKTNLLKYDGLNWETIPLQNPNFRYGKDQLVADVNGNLWIRGNEALVRYKNGNFTYFTKENCPIKGSIYACYPDRQGNIWLSTGQSVLRFSENDEWTKFDSIFSKPSYYTIIGFTEDIDGNILASTEYNQYATFRNEKWQPDNLPDCAKSDVKKIGYRSSDSTIIFGGRILFTFYKHPNCKSVNLSKLVNNNVFYLDNLEIDDKSVWISNNEHIFEWKESKPEFVKFEAGNAPFRENEITDLKQHNKLIYIVAGGNIYTYDRGKIDELPEPPIKSGRKIEFDKRGNLYLCGIGIASFNGKDWTKVSPDFWGNNDYVTSVGFDKDNKLWASNEHGLSSMFEGKWEFYSAADLKLQKFDRSILTSHHIAGLWYSTNNEVIHIDKKPEILFSTRNYDEAISCFAFDAKNNVWCGSKEKGITKLNTEGKPEGFIKPEIHLGTIIDMCVDAKGILWALSRNAMYKVEGNNWTQCWKAHDDKQSFYCLEIAYDQIFIGTDTGLLILSKR